MNNKDSLQLHISEEDEDEFEYMDLDIVSSIKDSRSYLLDSFDSIRSDMDILVSLENFATIVSRKDFISNSDVLFYNEIVDRNNNFNIRAKHLKVVSLESFATLASTGSSIASTASNITNKAFIAASNIKDGAIAGAAFAKMLYEKVQENIVKIAASWDFVCNMIEKRWLGITQLLNVYDLQHRNLVEKFEDIALTEESIAFFKVKLYVAKLRSDGRDISKTPILLESIYKDSLDLAAIGDSFISSISDFERADKLAGKALTLRHSYKDALVTNFNTVNNVLKKLADNDIFKNGGFVKGYQAQSRTLVGGKVIYINYNEEEVIETTSRNDLKNFNKNISFSAVKKRDGSTNDTETVEVNNLTKAQALTFLESVKITNDALRNYHDSNIPSLLKKRKSISSLISFATGLTGGNAAFDTIKRFFNNDDNLKAFNLIAPIAVSKLLGTFLAASSFAVFGGLVAASAATFLIDYLRKYVISNMFSMMDNQYKITDVIEKFDHDYIDTIIEVHNQGYRVCKKIASSRNWEK